MIPKNPLLFLAIALVFVAAFFSATEGNAQFRRASSSERIPERSENNAQDTVKVAPKGDIETTINYKAKDSIRYDAANQIMYLFGEAHIDYGEISLDAAFIEINWNTGILTATADQDSLGRLVQKPIFKNGAEMYESERIRYNYKSKKGIVTNTVTTQGEGFVHAQTVKRDSLGNIYGKTAKYTTCDLEHPHFYIKATKMKVIPNDRVVAGPFHMVFADVPLPIGLPFGFFPSPRKRGSGIIIPTFGETRLQGYYLRQGGFYWAMSDYMDMRITGDIYSLGGWGANVQSTYTKRYRYNGSFSLNYALNPAAENYQSRSLDETYLVRGPSSSNINISWSHVPVARPGKGQFSANVQASSAFYHQYNSIDPRLTLSNRFGSSISYGKSSTTSPFNYRISLRHSQGIENRTLRYKNKEGRDSLVYSPVQVMSFVLPDFSFGVASQSPIEWFGGTLTGRWIEGIRIGYNLSASQNVTNKISYRGNLGYPFPELARRDTVLSINGNNLAEIFDNGQRIINHDIPITLGTVSLFKYFKLTPGVSYNESWYTNKYTYRSEPGSDILKVDTTSGLHRVYQYSTSASLTTNLYGQANFKGKKIEAIRHTLTPNLSYSYRPDFGGSNFGYYQRVQSDSLGNTRLLSRFPPGGNLPGAGVSSAISFGIDNNVEMKVKTDSAGVFKKVSLIDRFAINGSYNMAADSFKLSNLSVDLSTRLFNSLPIQINATLDPYEYDGSRRINRYLFQRGGLNFARINNLNFSTRFEFSPKARQQQESADAPPPTNVPALQRTLTAADYVDFNIPWTLSAGFTSNFSRDLLTDRLMNQATSMDINGSVTLTDKWAFTYTTSYDFKNQALSYTNIAISRDLHCWQMSINWVPFGTMQMYSININAKSSLLRDLRIRRSDSAHGRAW